MLKVCIIAVGFLVSCLATLNESSPSRVTINFHRVVVIDGKPVFPIGFTMPPGPDAKAPNGKNGIEELRSAGATFLRTGPMAEPWSDEVFRREQRWLDLATRHGMHCLINLREAAAINGPASEALLRRILALFKDHPGLGCWKSVDEPEWGKQPIPPMLKARDILREMDPNHPIEVTQAPRGTVESLKPYNATTDILGADIYPVGYPPGIHSLLPNKQISMVGDYTKMMMEVAEGKLPVWMTLQIAWSGVIKPGKTLRFPTFAEERFMTYQTIINGARGLIYFGGHIPKAMTPEDAALGWNWRFWNRVLKPVIEEIGEFSPLYPALVAPDSKLPISAPGIELCAREVGNDLFILACKREGATVEVSFSGLPDSASDGEVLYESPRHVAAAKGAFKDWIGPFEVHVYRFKLR